MKEFHPFRLDMEDKCLWRGVNRIPLTPKGFDLLAYLVERAGRLVTQQELIENLWPNVFVQPEVLKSQIRDLRSTLGDDARKPHFIETVHRRGYRFIAQVREYDRGRKQSMDFPDAHAGRESNLEKLNRVFLAACSGRPQIVFVTGEVGIGKTTLCHAFESYLTRNARAVRVMRGQCVEGQGSTEPYFPILEALSAQIRGPDQDFMSKTLVEYAPTWCLRIPVLAKHKSLTQEVALGSSTERMLRELTDAMTEMAQQLPMVLILEDVHWVDRYTVDWIGSLARRNLTANLMVLATCNTVDLALSKNPLLPLFHELLANDLCHEVQVEPLSEDGIRGLVLEKAPGGFIPEGLVQFLYRHSEGNPLFVHTTLEHLIDRGLLLVRDGRWETTCPLADMPLVVPKTLLQLMEVRFEAQFDEKQKRILEAASMCGFSFTSKMVAIVAEMEAEETDEMLSALAGHLQAVRYADALEQPDVPSLTKFEFVHHLYREMLYRHISPVRRCRLHGRVHLALESIYEGRLNEVASQLAYHAELAEDWTALIRDLVLVAEVETNRFEYQTAKDALDRASGLLAKLRDEAAASFELQIKLLRDHISSRSKRSL